MENFNISRSILKAILYFDIFSYPLLSEEIKDYCNFPGLSLDDCQNTLDYLKKKGVVNYYKGFYFINNDFSIVNRRVEENKLADIRMKTAITFSKIISNFPFVRAVLISGSLSKRVMKQDSDIDFFIITKPGRLWLCRSLLIAFKKIFLGNSRKNFCLNYFIDGNSLSIPDRNLYTASEIAFLLPMYNYQLYREFLIVNDWYRIDYPNLKVHDEIKPISTFWTKKLAELFFNNLIGDLFDHIGYKVFSIYSKTKYKNLDAKSYSVSIRSLKNVAKYHPNSYQEQVLKIMEHKMNEFELSTGYSLSESHSFKLIPT